MWHWPQVSGVRASSTEAACRAWHAVHAPMVPSLFGRPMSWHFWHPTAVAAAPSIFTNGWGGRSTALLWNFSEKATCSGVNPALPVTAAHAGAACRLRRYWSYSVEWHCLQLAAVTDRAIEKPRWAIAS